MSVSTQICCALISHVDAVASTSRKIVVADEDVQIMLEHSDSDLGSVNSEIDSDHFIDYVAVIDTLVNYDDNEVEVASAESFVWEDMSYYK